MKEYKKLDRTANYDREAVEEYADAANELAVLLKRTNELTELLDDNRELSKFVWRTGDGQSIAIHLIEDNHLNNIVNHAHELDYPLSREVKAEAKRRGISTESNPWLELTEFTEGMPDED